MIGFGRFCISKVQFAPKHLPQGTLGTKKSVLEFFNVTKYRLLRDNNDPQSPTHSSVCRCSSEHTFLTHIQQASEELLQKLPASGAILWPTTSTHRLSSIKACPILAEQISTRSALSAEYVDKADKVGVLQKSETVFPALHEFAVSSPEAHDFQTSIVHLSINVDILVLLSDPSPYNLLDLSSVQNVRSLISSRSFTP